MLINFILSDYKVKENNWATKILKHEKIINKIQHIPIELNKKYGYKNLEFKEIQIIASEEIYFTLVDFKQNFFKISASSNIEASFFAYLNKRVIGRIINVLRKRIKDDKYISKYGKKLMSQHSLSLQKQISTFDIVAEKEVKKELIQLLDALPELDRKVIYSRAYKQTDYNTLAHKHGTKSTTLRKRHERAVVKLRKAIAENSILLDPPV